MMMSTLNKLKETVESYRSTLESQTYWAPAVPPSTELTMMTRVRRIKYTTTRYDGGNYIAAKAKADELEANPNITEISLNESEPDTYILTGTLKDTGAWGSWY